MRQTAQVILSIASTKIASYRIGSAVYVVLQVEATIRDALAIGNLDASEE